MDKHCHKRQCCVYELKTTETTAGEEAVRENPVNWRIKFWKKEETLQKRKKKSLQKRGRKLSKKWRGNCERMKEALRKLRKL